MYDHPTSFALITKYDAQLSAHQTYTNVAVGGTLTIYDTSQYKAVDGVAYIKAISPTKDYKVNFNKGLKISSNPLGAAGVDFSVFECIATNAKNYEGNGYKVKVITGSGTFTQDDVRPPEWQDYDQGKTLVIFTTTGTVRLAASPLKRKWGPSVIAPFANVIIDDNNDFNDGYVVAKSFKASSTLQQLHGNEYKGPSSCDCSVNQCNK
jgi:hypothetical protein